MGHITKFTAIKKENLLKQLAKKKKYFADFKNVECDINVL